MGKILTKEVGEHYKLLESDFQSSYILEKMLNSFKGKESKWYSSEKGKQMLQAGGKKMESLRVTALSINYQEHLNYTIEFHENEIQEMVNKLNPFLDSLNNNQVATVFQNPFASSLLKYRLETGDRIFLMVDGFDEIDSQC